MNIHLAEAILKTVAPPWYAEGTALIPEYADELEEKGLIVKLPDGRYKQTKEGCVLSDRLFMGKFESGFVKDSSDILEQKFCF